MLALVLSTFATLQVVTPAPARLAPTPVAVVAAVAMPAADTPSDEYLARARKAFDQGDFQAARRDYVIAAALERDAGRVPVVASFALSRVLFAQSNNKEAAQVLTELAREASAKGDDNTEARALADAIWLNRESHQLAQVRADAARLRDLLKGKTLSAETRRIISETTS
ncbi:hypothetical protein GAU_2711 [Gemmatimonas aurantiaca T-27]|uniref:Tetratricopeptide repeat protein n=2 Tax=Gemmatimonas aurantiaca TaxID=173480 RepID=C1AAF5_GEMAT|nr:hypothetical protein GAU_2711 [Gemmatimonas aurantiaca T-27]